MLIMQERKMYKRNILKVNGFINIVVKKLYLNDGVNCLY